MDYPKASGEVLRFRVRESRGTMIGVVAFFGLGAPLMLHRALTNESGMTIKRLIELDRSSATAVYWLLFAFAAVCVIVGIAGVIRSFGPDRWIELDDRSVTGPSDGFRSGATSIAYAEIANIEVFEVRSERWLEIRSRDGTLLRVNERDLPDSDLDEVASSICDRAGFQ